MIVPAMPSTIQPRYLSIRDAAKYTSLGVSTLEQAARANKFTTFVQARRRLIVRESLEAWIEGRVDEVMKEVATEA